MSLIPDLIDELGHTSLKRHSQAFRQLLDLGSRALPDLRRALEESPLSERTVPLVMLVADIRSETATQTLIETGNRLYQAKVTPLASTLLAEVIHGVARDATDDTLNWLRRVCDYPSVHVQLAAVEALASLEDGRGIGHLNLLSLRGLGAAKREAARALRRLQRQEDALAALAV